MGQDHLVSTKEKEQLQSALSNTVYTTVKDIIVHYTLFTLQWQGASEYSTYDTSYVWVLCRIPYAKPILVTVYYGVNRNIVRNIDIL
jgi:hypothetical protein